MDRNLGATSATPGDVGALGLLYQWGRKDPFLGSSDTEMYIIAESTIIWPSSVLSDSRNGTISYALTHPTTFIVNNYINDDWYYTGSSSTDNTRWTTSRSEKSIYDPCPAGWRVPDGGRTGVWSKAKGSLSSKGSVSYFSNDYNTTIHGMNFSGMFGAASSIWYPASGYRRCDDSSLYQVGYYGGYWSASPYTNYAYDLYFCRSKDCAYPSYNNPRSYGFSVRCLQEID